jgi:hypothetical protein
VLRASRYRSAPGPPLYADRSNIQGVVAGAPVQAIVSNFGGYAQPFELCEASGDGKSKA